MRRSVLLVWLTLAGCSSVAETTSPTTAGAAPDRAARISNPSETAPDPSSGPHEAAVVPSDIHYDLAQFVARGEIRQGRAWVLDFSHPGAAKYTLGGWLTGIESRAVPDGDAQEEGDARHLGLVTGTRGKLFLPWEPAEAEQAPDAWVTVRARLFRPGPLHVYLGQEQVAAVELPRDGSFGVVRVRLPGEDLAAGERRLLLRVARTGPAPGGGRAGLGIDWVRVEPAGAEDGRAVEDVEPPRLAELTTQQGEHTGLRLPKDVGLSWTLDVPENGRLRGVVTSGRLEVVAKGEEGDARRLGGAEAGEEGGRLDLDLSPLAGSLSRLELRASGDAPAVVLRPAVVTPRERSPRDFEPPKNVLVYLVDTLRADKLSPYAQDTRVRTPGLTRFLEGTTTVARAQAQENWTKPSVATLLSALMPWQHTAVRGESVVPRSVALLPEMLKDRGFFTGSFIANGYVSDRFGFRQGWDTYRNYIRESRRTEAEHVAADVLTWLDDRPEDQPFFLYVHTIDPHVPYRPPDEHLEPYGDASYRGPVSFRRSATLLEQIKTGKLRLRGPDKAQLEALYDGEISYHDVHFASIMDGLERRGLSDNTMVVVTSDHGEEFWDHGSVGHGHSVWQELLHVPLFVRLPGVTDDLERFDSPVGLVDVVPTILEALGEEAPEDLAGSSFLNALRGEPDPAPRHAVAGFMDGWRTIVVGDLKLIQRTPDQAMLFDLAQDPGEERDLAENRPLALHHTRALLGLALSDAEARPTPGRRRRPQRHEAEDTTIDAETAAQLRALGYVH